MSETTPPLLHAPEPRWPAVVALLALAGLHVALPPQLAVGQPWLVPTVVGILLIPTLVTLRQDHDHRLHHLFGFLALGFVTMAEVWSLTLLVQSLPAHTLLPNQLLQSAGALWVTNVLVFALWYWRLDAGGPHVRNTHEVHRDRMRQAAFLFPQMTLGGCDRWRPHFVDYLFLAFNHSMALSPTDTAILSRWAKWLIMLQASISLATTALIAARAVNIL
jgi:uncharacterized membrane protein